MSPRGGLLLCEDAAGSGLTEGERLIGLTLAWPGLHLCSEQHRALTERYNPDVPAWRLPAEPVAGACYSPDGKWLFVNIQKPGVTLAITGPWGCEGPL